MGVMLNNRKLTDAFRPQFTTFTSYQRCETLKGYLGWTNYQTDNLSQQELNEAAQIMENQVAHWLEYGGHNECWSAV